MSDKIKNENQAKAFVFNKLMKIKELANEANEVAEEYNLFSDTSRILDVSVHCDECIAEITKDMGDEDG